MANKNTESTRYYSDAQEKSVCKALGANQTPNSGAGLWTKGDVIQREAKMLIECKTCIEPKNSFSIKKDWIEKNRLETFEMRLNDSAIAFNFGPSEPNYYVINEKLMKFLVEKLIEEYDN